jgi:hypothetical protein
VESHANETGIVVYKINGDGTLEGVWAYPPLGGRVGTEIARGGSPGKIEGDYEVTIYGSNKEEIYNGNLKIEKEGEVYKLEWTGDLLIPPRREMSFTGIGLMAGQAYFAATWSM